MSIEPNERVYTASQSADSHFETWTRSGDGRADLSDIPLEVLFRGYGRQHVRLTVDAAGDSDGLVTWALTAEQAKKLGHGLLQIVIRRADRGELLHRGTLEVQV